MFHKADEWLIAKVQGLYLWAFDWTGLYVGTLLMLVGGAVPALALVAKGKMLWALLLFAAASFGGGLNYMMQAKAQYERYNAMAMFTEGSKIRRFFNFLNITLFVVEFVTLNLDSVISLCTFFYWYLLCIKIREREPKEFKFLKPAYQKQGSR